jgi:Flp pilus assembly protein TadD
MRRESQEVETMTTVRNMKSWIILPLLAGSLTACATSRTAGEDEVAAGLSARASIVPSTQAEREAIRSQDLLSQAAFWAEAHELNPADREAAIELSTVLRRLGSTRQAEETARQAMALFPNDPDILFAYGTAMIAEGRGMAAIEPLARAEAARPDDWRIKNALGVAYESAGMPEEARTRFRSALNAAPTEPSILSNLALSYAMAGDPEQAETLLRDAIGRPGAGATIRQNLALVIALQGRFDEAETMARVDVSPAMAESNLAYVRAMLTSQRRWDAIRGDDGAP